MLKDMSSCSLLRVRSDFAEIWYGDPVDMLDLLSAF